MFRLLLIVAVIAGSTVSVAAKTETNKAERAKVHLVVWRGCEDACEAFIRFFKDQKLPVDVEVTDIARDHTLLPTIRKNLRAQAPDLVVTWGTSVTRGILGTRADYGQNSALGNIPALFMIVADPVGSDIVESFANSGRPLISGVLNRVPEDVQLQILFQFFRPSKLGVINDPSELNSQLNTAKLRAISGSLGFEVVEVLYATNDEGEVDPTKIPGAMAQLKERGAEAIYVGSSSFNLQNQKAFVAEATALGLPVFSAYTQMVRDSGALIAVGASYANVGRLAATQAEKVVLAGKQPGDLPVKSLKRFSVILNMASARALKLYPPLSLLGIAEVVQ